MRLPFAVLTFLLAATLAAQSEEPLFRGNITRIDPSGTFDLGGVPLKFAPRATFSKLTGKDKVDLPAMPPLAIGQSYDCFCRFDRKKNTLTATHLTLIAPLASNITSGAIIEKIDNPDGGPAKLTVRADGYHLLLPDGPSLHFEDNLNRQQLAPNQWVAYKGTLAPDGTVTVDEATIWLNQPGSGEAKLRDRQEMTTDPNASQNEISRFFLGVDATKLPLHNDPAMSARVERIGQRLIPACQRDLSAGDPSKLPFRFLVVETTKIRYPVGLTSGIVVIPSETVARLPSDDQLAALLANAVAYILEKQEFLDRGKHQTLTTARMIGTAAELVPGVGLGVSLAATAGSITAGGLQESLEVREARQRDRVSLWLLHDAGFDLAQAPIAWWQMASRKPAPLADIVLPRDTADLYAYLAMTWNLTASQAP